MSRKGQVGEAIPWVMRFIASVILLIVLAAQISMLTSYRQDPKEAELGIYVTRLINGPHGLLYEDPARGTPVPGVLDAKKLRLDYYQGVYDEPKELERYGACVRVRDRAREIGEACNEACTIVHHPELFDQYCALADAGLDGRGGGILARHVIPVLVRSVNGDDVKWLDITAVRRT